MTIYANFWTRQALSLIILKKYYPEKNTITWEVLSACAHVTHLVILTILTNLLVVYFFEIAIVYVKEGNQLFTFLIEKYNKKVKKLNI